MAIFTAKLVTRNGTAAEWTAANPTLLEGERGIETDTGLEKVGDGSTAWNTLPYWNPLNNRIKLTSTGIILKAPGNTLDTPQVNDLEFKYVSGLWEQILHT